MSDTPNRQFLDKDGLIALWTKIKAYVSESIEEVASNLGGDIADLAKLTNRVTTNENNIAENKVSINSLTTKVNSIDTTVSGHTTSISNLSNNLSTLNNTVNTNTTNISTNTTNIGNLTTELDTVKTSLPNYRGYTYSEGRYADYTSINIKLNPNDYNCSNIPSSVKSINISLNEPINDITSEYVIELKFAGTVTTFPSITFPAGTKWESDNAIEFEPEYKRYIISFLYNCNTANPSNSHITAVYGKFVS